MPDLSLLPYVYNAYILDECTLTLAHYCIAFYVYHLFFNDTTYFIAIKLLVITFFNNWEVGTGYIYCNEK